MFRNIKATEIEKGTTLDDDQFPHVMDVGHVRVGPKWVTAWAFHPDASVYPNPGYRVPVGGTVRIWER